MRTRRQPPDGAFLAEAPPAKAGALRPVDEALPGRAGDSDALRGARAPVGAGVPDGVSDLLATALGRSAPLADTKDEEPDHLGHRDRVRARFTAQGGEGFADYELLELLLFGFFRQRDTKPIAKALLRRFGSVGGVLGADLKALQEVKGIGPTIAVGLKAVQALNQRALKEDARKTPVLSSWQAVLDYCHAAMAHETREQFRLLFLDKRNRLMADEVQGRGTVDHTPVYPREIVRRALELGATALILVHNHPSGDTTPSRADIDMTREIMAATKPLGIAVHDHVIIGRDGHASLRRLKLM